MSTRMSFDCRLADAVTPERLFAALRPFDDEAENLDAFERRWEIDHDSNEDDRIERVVLLGTPYTDVVENMLHVLLVLGGAGSKASFTIGDEVQDWSIADDGTLDRGALVDDDEGDEEDLVDVFGG